jgi:hypothetical protein
MSVLKLDVNSNLANTINDYITAFGSSDLFFEKFFEFHKNELKREISLMQIDLEDFEKKYLMKSDEFFEKFEKGQLGDSEDYIIWSGIYEMQSESKKKLSKLP